MTAKEPRRHEEPDLGPGDEDILDRLWDRIGAQGPPPGAPETPKETADAPDRPDRRP
jgi:hypothetical protein